MTQLYVASGACSFGAHVAARELGLPIEIIKVPIRDPNSPIHRVNPLGRVPTLVTDGGDVITENGAILPFLADLKPDSGLGAPAGSVERARIQKWIGFLNSEVHAIFRTVNRPNLFHADESVQPAIRRRGQERLRGLLSVIQARLEGRNWVLGERFTVADAYLGVFLRWLPRAEISIEDFPPLAAYLARYNARDSVQAAAAFEASQETPL